MTTIKEWLEDLSQKNTSTEEDSRVMQNYLRKIGFPSAVVVIGVVYPEGYGPPVSIHSMAKNILEVAVIQEQAQGKQSESEQPESEQEESEQIYAKRADKDNPIFKGRSNIVAAGEEVSVIPIPDNVTLCDGCNQNTEQGYLIYLSKQDLDRNTPYDYYCDDCTKKYFGKAVYVE